MDNDSHPKRCAQGVEQKSATMVLAFSDEMLEGIRVGEVWEILRRKSRSEQRDLVRNHLRFTTPALFHLLREKSVPEGRVDRKYGVHLAELAIECLHALEQVVRRPLFDLRAQGWAWVGNARRLAFDFIGSDQAFSVGEDFLSTVGHQSLIHAEHYTLKATLRHWQRRFPEALELNEQAFSIFQSIGKTKQIAEVLVERAYICEQAGDAAAAIHCLVGARRQIAKEAEPFLQFCITYNLASVQAKSGKLHEAADLLPLICKLGAAAGIAEEKNSHIHWLQAYVMRENGELAVAEQLFRQACEGFLRKAEVGYAMITSLDLALLLWNQRRYSDVHTLVSEMLPIVDGLNWGPEQAACVELLGDAIRTHRLNRVTLESVRSRLETPRLDPKIPLL